MAVPKSKITRSRRGMRRSHDALKGTNIVECPNCGEFKLAHHVCSACGYYNKKEIIDMVFVDEIQFLNTADTIKNVDLILNEGIDVVCAGLDQDSRGKPWETSSMILGLSDKILKIYGFCNVCGMEATKTYRKQEGGDRTQVGAANIYEPRCLKHWTPR
mgnify:CR=1 FL=1